MMHLFLVLAAALSVHASPAVPPYEEILTRPLKERLTLFTQLKPGSYRFLIHEAWDADKNLQLRWRAVTTMGRLNPRYFRSNLNKALRSHEWFMRNAALIAIQTERDRAHAVGWAMRLLNDPALVVRTQAVRDLIVLDATRAEPRLWHEMFARRNFRGDESLWIRAHIAQALAKFAEPGETSLFKRLLLDRDQRLYKWAILGLEKTTGLKLSSTDEPIAIQREKWLSRLGVQEI